MSANTDAYFENLAAELDRKPLGDRAAYLSIQERGWSQRLAEAQRWEARRCRGQSPFPPGWKFGDIITILNRLCAMIHEARAVPLAAAE